MMKTSKPILIAIAVIPLAILLGILLRHPAEPVSSPERERVAAPPAPRGREAVPDAAPTVPVTREEVLKEAYDTPIEFYGKVVDQNGDPVVDASVSIRLDDDSPANELKITKMVSDSDGLFSIKGVKGLGISVMVEKEGYLEKDESKASQSASIRNVAFAGDPGRGARYKDPAKPTVFTLHKLGPMEPLVYVSKSYWELPIDGTVRNIALDNEKGTGVHQIEFRYTSDWPKVSKAKPSSWGPFDWSLELRIPGGGFVKSRSDYVFEAPESGYVERIVKNHPKNAAKWDNHDEGLYFVKFSDGTYGRIRLSVEADTADAPLRMTTWINPKTGSRNLATNVRDGTVLRDDWPE